MPGRQSCVGGQKQFYSPRIFSRHKNNGLKELRQSDASCDDSHHSPTVQLPQTLPELSREIIHGNVNHEDKSEAKSKQSTPCIIPDLTASTHCRLQEQAMNDADMQREESSMMTAPENNAVIDHPEDIANSNSFKRASAPQSLNQELSNYFYHTLNGSASSQQPCPSTASGAEEPVLQVKATPYINSHLLKCASTEYSPLSSPIRKKSNPLNDMASAREPNETLPSPIVFESSKPMEGTMSVFSHNETSKKDSTSADFEAGKVHVPKPVECQTTGSAFRRRMSEHDLTHVEDTFVTATAPAPLRAFSGDDIVECHSTTARDNASQSKRKFPELQARSPDSAKRPKHVKSPTLNYSKKSPKTVASSPMGRKKHHESYHSRESSVRIISDEGTPGDNGTLHRPLNLASSKEDSSSGPKRSELNKAIRPHEDEGRNNVFNQFRTTYPQYVGTLDQFMAICNRIKRLSMIQHMVHQYLWDDFIIRHRTDYPIYLSLCADTADDPLPYEQFYHEKITKPLFTKGVVNRENLSRVTTPSRKADANDQLYLQGENDLNMKNVVKRKVVELPSGPTKSSPGTGNLGSPKVTVDLTSDNEASPTKRKKEPIIDLVVRKSPRSLPWHTPSRSRVERSSASQANPRASSSNRISDSSPLSARPSTFRSPAHSGLIASISKKVALSTGKEEPSLLQRDASMNRAETGEASGAVTQKPSIGLKSNRSDPPGPSQPLRILMNAQSLDSISHKDTETNENSRCRSFKTPKQLMPNQANRSPRPQDGKLSVIPSPAPQVNSRGETQCEEQHDTSKKDEDHPFTKFARAYIAIRGGNGNSYARDRVNKNEKEGSVPEVFGGSPTPMPIDVLSWKL